MAESSNLQLEEKASFLFFFFFKKTTCLLASTLSCIFIISTMGNALTDTFWLCFVSLLWGSTNPLIRKGSKGIEEIRRSSRIQQFLAEVIFLASNWKYLVPFLLNQCGSVVFYLTLASVDLSIAVPITNSLTLLITTLVGRILGEGKINAGTFLGMVLVISGVSICVMDQAT